MKHTSKPKSSSLSPSLSLSALSLPPLSLFPSRKNFPPWFYLNFSLFNYFSFFSSPCFGLLALFLFCFVFSCFSCFCFVCVLVLLCFVSFCFVSCFCKKCPFADWIWMLPSPPHPFRSRLAPGILEGLLKLCSHEFVVVCDDDHSWSQRTAWELRSWNHNKIDLGQQVVSDPAPFPFWIHKLAKIFHIFWWKTSKS